MTFRILTFSVVAAVASASHADSTYTTGFEDFSAGAFVTGSPATQGGWGWLANYNMVPTVVGAPVAVGSKSLAIMTYPTDAEQASLSGTIGGTPSVAVSPIGEVGMTSYSGMPVIGNRLSCSFLLQTPAAGTLPNSLFASNDYGWRLEIQPARRENEFANRNGRINVGDGAVQMAGVPNGAYETQYDGSLAGASVTPRSAADKIYLQIDWPFIIGPETDATDAAWKVAFINGLDYSTWYRVEYDVQYVNGTGTAMFDGVSRACANDVVTVRVYNMAGTLVGSMTGSTWEAGFRAGSWGSPTFAMDCMGVKAAKPAGAGQSIGVIDQFSMTSYSGFSALSLVASDTIIQPTEQLVVDVQLEGQVEPAVGAQIFLDFDTSRLQVASINVAPGSPFSREIYSNVNNTTGKIIYASGIPDSGNGSTSNLSVARVVFNVVPGTEDCDASGLVTFTQGLSVGTRVAASGGVNLIPSLTELGDIKIDATAPVFAGLPSDVSIASDAGTVAGAYVAPPTVTATDVCDGATNVSLVVTYPNNTTATTWPANGIFPQGMTTLAYSTVDAAGNTSSASRTITVANHQLLDATLTLNGVIAGNSTRATRVKAGSSTQVVSVAMTGASGTISGLAVPVASSYPCVSAKGTSHTVTDTAAASVVGTRYSADFSLRQGDSNDDDLIDILDFAIYIGDFGAAGASDVSNFNADNLVGTVDFTFISIGFLRTGEACGGSFAGGVPRKGVTVRELRRMGLGHLAAADLDRNGIVNEADMMRHLSGQGVAEPTVSDEPTGRR